MNAAVKPIGAAWADASSDACVFDPPHRQGGGCLFDGDGKYSILIASERQHQIALREIMRAWREDLSHECVSVLVGLGPAGPISVRIESRVVGSIGDDDTRAIATALGRAQQRMAECYARIVRLEEVSSTGEFFRVELDVAEPLSLRTLPDEPPPRRVDRIQPKSSGQARERVFIAGILTFACAAFFWMQHY